MGMASEEASRMALDAAEARCKELREKNMLAAVKVGHASTCARDP